MNSEPIQQPGIAVDSRGGAVIDPSQNVRELFEAGAIRQDDLRQLNDKRIDAEIRVLAMQLDGIEKRMMLRAEHAKEIRLLETERVDAIRRVDVLAGNTAADRALVAIQTLATQTTAERETLRNLVTTSASTLATQNAADLAGIREAISALQKTSYEGAGKGTGKESLGKLIALGVGLLVSLFMAALTVGGIVVAIAFAIRG